VTELAGDGAVVESIRVLAGGTHAATFLVELVNPSMSVVVREFPVGDSAGRREIRVLTSLDGLAGMAPRLLASDTGGTWSDRPTVVISRLPGVADIRPRDPERWAEELGRTLARVHATPASRRTDLASLSDRDGGTVAMLDGPAAAAVQAGWAALNGAPSVLVHYDFWSGNVLWSQEKISGVVDWSGAVNGPAGFDVGWCRLDLYLLFGEHIADVFFRAYESAAGGIDPEQLALWDLWALARSHRDVEGWVDNYGGLGRTDLTAAELRRRHEAWTTHVMGVMRER
jgi:aminoglycoside phosphotransferase (APT) family kinase protein